MRQGDNQSLDSAGNYQLYKDPFNINGNVHPGVSGRMRGDKHDTNDSRRKMRPSQNESDGELFAKSSKGGMFDGNLSVNNGRSSDPNLLHPNSYKAGGNKHRRGSGDDEDDYIVGPESNLSSIKKRP